MNEIYYRQNIDIAEYLDIYLDTSLVILKKNVTSLDLVDVVDLSEMYKLESIDTLRSNYGTLYIDEIRRSYDNDMFLLISGKIILAIEYILNSVLNIVSRNLE